MDGLGGDAVEGGSGAVSLPFVRRLVGIVIAVALVAVACGDGEGGGYRPGDVPAAAVDAARRSLAGSPLAGMPDADLAADIADGCSAAAGEGVTSEGFLAAVAAIVDARVAVAGQPIGGDLSARYSQVLGAAGAQVCPEEMGAALGLGAPEFAGDVPYEERLQMGLRSFALSLQGTPFEGLPADPLPEADLEVLAGSVCASLDGGGDTAAAVRVVTDDLLARYGGAQANLDLLIVSVVSFAVIFVCPAHADRVLGS